MSAALDRRLAALGEAAELAEGRLDAELVADARAVTAKAGARLGLGLEATVVALAGPTGAGKSLLFNRLTGTDLASVGRRRPTTSTAQAAVWGDGADPLLDWLEVPRRHRLDAADLRGLVLLDLPDFDSIQRSHRLEVDRIVGLADLVVWVVEPQKYADAALHDRYLRPLASHADAMAVVLNQSDLLRPAEIDRWREDMERLLGEDGLRGAPIVVVSSATQAGLPELRRLLGETVAAREAAVKRLAADVDAAAARFAPACAGGAAPGVGGAERARLVAALEDAAGVAQIVRAVGAAHRRRGALATGWPFVRWIRRLRPDPLKRLRLPDSPEPSIRTSLPPPTDVQQAQVATAARRLADSASDGLAAPWPGLVRARATAHDAELADRLDRAVAAADLHARSPRWWRGISLLQRLLALVAVVGALWLLALAVLGYLRLDDVVPVPEYRDVAIPTWLLVVSVAAGLVLSFLTRVANGASARRRSRAARRSLRSQIDAVAQELVVTPVEDELEARERLCRAVETASRGRERATRLVRR